MAKSIKFYFDFSSTFSYIATHRIDELAARYGATVDWRVISLGHLFAAQNIVPPPTIPSKVKYLSIDFRRCCEFENLPSAIPTPFPPDVKIARQVFWYLKANSDSSARNFARAISRTLFGQGQPVSTPDQILRACSGEVPLSQEDISAAGQDSAVKAKLVDALNDAVADGMVGAPFFVLECEPFWGADRMAHLERRLKGQSP